MARLTVDALTLSGVPLAVGYSASGGQITTLTNVLQRAEVPHSRYVLINPATGTYLTTALSIVAGPLAAALGGGVPATYNGSPEFAVTIARHGGVFVDYGLWPFGQFPGLPGGRGVVAPSVGFTGFVDTAGVVTTVPPIDYVFHETNLTELAQAYGRQIKVADPYAWGLNAWTMGNTIQTTYHYPYGYGLLTQGVPSARLRPLGPYQRMAVRDPRTGVLFPFYIYSAVAIRVGSGWYCNAVTNIAADAYARALVRLLGGYLPVAVPSTPSCAAAVKPSLQVGDAGGWVALAQARLNAWGAHVPLTGTFDAATQQAVLAFQRAHAGQQVGHAPAVLPSGQIGPGLWALLCSTPRGGQGSSGGRGHAHHRAPRQPAAPGLVQWLMTHLNLTQAEAELVLVGGGVTALVLLSGK
jgi:hypothetical protein